MKRPLPTLLFAALTASCTVVRPIPHEPLPAPSPPTPNIDTHIERLDAELAQLKQHINSLQTRIQQLERSKTTPPSRPTRTTPRQTNAKKTNNKRTPSIAARSPTATSFTNTTLTQAREHYRTGNHAAVLKTLRHAENGGDGSEIDRQSMFLLLRSHYKLNNCESTINIGQRYIQSFRATPEAAETMLIIGQCQWQMQQKDIARNTWRKLIHIYPDSAAAKRAAQQLQ